MAKKKEILKEVSDATLLADIKNTQLEKDAYEKLADGYETLAKLPENKESGASNLHFMRYEEFSRLALGCGTLLETLLTLKTLRRLDP